MLVKLSLLVGELLSPAKSLPGARSLFLVLLALVPPALAAIYISAYGQNVPLGDQWHLGSRVALAAADGRLNLSDLTYMDDGHRTVFTNLTTAFMVFVTHWNIKTEMFLNLILIAACFGLLGLLLKRAQIPAFPLVFVVLSALFFSLNRETSWLQWRHSGWNFAALFLFGALLALTRVPNTAAVFIAMLCALCATFSTAIGILTWPVLGVSMWMLGYRHWGWYSFWIIAALASASLYLAGSSISAGSVEGSREQVMNALQNPDPVFLARFTAIYLARTVTGFQQYFDFMVVISTVGILSFISNAAYLWRMRRQPQALTICVALALYSLAAPFLIAQGRSFLDLGHALTVQYIAASSLFWIAGAALSIISVHTITAKVSPNSVERLLFFANVMFGVMFVGLYLYANLVALQRSADYWQHPLELQDADELHREEDCVRAFLFSRETACMEALLPRSSVIDLLAARRLAIFAEQTPVSILPPTYQAGSPIVIAAGEAWLNVHVRDWLLSGIGEGHLIHVIPNNAEALDAIQQLPNPLRTMIPQTADNINTAFDGVNDDTREVWLVRAANVRMPTIVRDILRERDYLSIYDETLTEPMPLVLQGFARLAQPPQILFHVGQSLTLEGWVLESSADVQPCASIPVTTLWRTSSALPRNLSMTLVLADLNGVGVTRNDAPPAGLEMERWLVDQLYLDRRGLTLPCDLATGSYSLLVGIYDYTTRQSLEASAPDGTLVGGLIYLTSIQVN